MESQPRTKEFTIWRVFPLRSAFVIGKVMMDSLNEFPQPGSQMQTPGREGWKGKWLTVWVGPLWQEGCQPLQQGRPSHTSHPHAQLCDPGTVSFFLFPDTQKIWSFMRNRLVFKYWKYSKLLFSIYGGSNRTCLGAWLGLWATILWQAGGNKWTTFKSKK